ncbi:MAG TPA: transglycosylase domain-containing protein, partial [Chloroflexota bacterium]|nr:transglycosylase domain-containing protein [Chloroflexota bacterium]
DTLAIARALIQNYTASGVRSGASTITMQLVKNTLIPPEERYKQSYTRKINEVLLSYQLSQRYDKDELLAMYLNEIYYGNLAYGIEAAARVYFNKAALELTLPEAALIAGLPQSPSYYDPYVRPDKAKERQEYVLDNMVEHGFLDRSTADAAKQTPLILTKPQPQEIKAPHFVFYVRDELERRFGRDAVYYGGLQVTTTIDLKALEVAERVANATVRELQEQNANNAAIIVIDPRTGEILTMMGSVNYRDETIDGQVNMAVAERQPGSALKPFTYLTGFMYKGVTPATIINDVEKQFSQGPGLPPYVPRNHDRQQRGPIPVRQALTASLNIPAVEMLHLVGIPAFLDTLHRAGIRSITGEHYGLAITLGAAEVRLLDLTFAYTSLANNGRQIGDPIPLELRRQGMAALEPTAILKVEDSLGNVLHEYTPHEQQIFPAEHAFQISTILMDDNARAGTYGPRSYLNLSRPAAAKTGTTDNYEDGWTFGYTPDLVVGTWIGNADRSRMRAVQGVAGAGRIWNAFMEEWLRDKPVIDFTPPQGVVLAQTCRPDSYRFNAPANGFEPLAPKSPLPLPPGAPALDWFVRGTEPRLGGQIAAYSSVYQQHGRSGDGQVQVVTRHVLADCSGRPMQYAEVANVLPPMPMQPIAYQPGQPRQQAQTQPGVLPSAPGVVASMPTPRTGLDQTPTRTVTPVATGTPVATPTNTPGAPGSTPIPSSPPPPTAAAPPPPPTATPPPPPPTATPAPLPPTPTPASIDTGGRVAMPNLVGVPEDEARRRIESLGLSNAPTNHQQEGDVPPEAVEFFHSIQPGHVLSHAPGPGQIVDRGTTIHIAVRAP